MFRLLRLTLGTLDFGLHLIKVLTVCIDAVWPKYMKKNIFVALLLAFLKADHPHFSFQALWKNFFRLRLIVVFIKFQFLF